MAERIIMLIPVYNEELNIGKVIDEVRATLPKIDIFVINDCSQDNTEKVLQQYSDIKYSNLPFNMGYAGALQTGFKYAVANNYDYVIQFDGDGQHIASESKKLLKLAIEDNIDIVIGSRFIKQTEYKHSFFRSLGTRFFVGLIKRISGYVITDPTSGFQVLNKHTFSIYARINGYPEFPDANLLIKMLLSNFTVKEVNVEMREREFGESMHSGVIKPIKYMVNMTYSIFLILIDKVLSRRRKNDK